jgi:hypothetical protein
MENNASFTPPSPLLQHDLSGIDELAAVRMNENGPHAKAFRITKEFVR